MTTHTPGTLADLQVEGRDKPIRAMFVVVTRAGETARFWESCDGVTYSADSPTIQEVFPVPLLEEQMDKNKEKKSPFGGGDNDWVPRAMALATDLQEVIKKHMK